MASPRLPHRGPDDQDELRSETYTRAALVLRDTTWMHAGEIALEVGTSQRMIQSWGEPQRQDDCPRRRQPLLDLLYLMRAAVRLAGPEIGLAPLRWLAEELGHRVLRQPSGEELGSLEREYREAMAAVGQIAVDHLEVTADGEVSPQELERVLGRLAAARHELDDVEAAYRRAAGSRT